MTVVPAKKNTASSAKKTLQGCIACTTAVAKAVRMPTGVSDLRDQARYTSAAMAGTAMYGFMVGLLDGVRSSRRCLQKPKSLASQALGIPSIHQQSALGTDLAVTVGFKTFSSTFRAFHTSCRDVPYHARTRMIKLSQHRHASPGV